MAKNSRRKSRVMGIVVIILLIIAIALATTLAVIILKDKYVRDEELTMQEAEADEEQTTQEEAKSFVHSSDYQLLPDENGIPVAQIDVDLSALKNINEDACGWIYIPEAEVNCAVVCNEWDTDYYLSNDISNISGVFIQKYNKNDFTDRMTVMYGKKQNDKSQFEGILKYQDKSFFESHKYIYVSTGDKILTYKVFAAHKAYAEHLMLGYDWSIDQVFIDYLTYILKSGDDFEQTDVETAIDIDPGANIDPSVEILVSDRVLTLSERIDGEDNYRYLVQGVLINESIKETP